MGGLIEPLPGAREPQRNWTAVGIGIAAILAVVALLYVVSKLQPKNTGVPNPYIQNVKLTDFKMSTAQNFVGANVTYIDGTVSNAGDKTVTHAMVHVVFRNSLGEAAQEEDVALRVLQTSGPYPDTVDLSAIPLGAGMQKQFRLTFEHVTTDWNQAYPELRVTGVTVK